MMKKILLEKIKSLLNDRMKIAFDAMQAAQASANEEGKSSAGDKYETGRAMAQIERDKYAKQHHLAQQDSILLDRIDEKQVFTQIGFGALAETSAGLFFLAVSIGLLKIDEKEVLVVSQQSPIGNSLFGKKVGDFFIFREKKCQILSIY
jgi:hypothetical protein